jgi:hypothetical protein
MMRSSKLEEFFWRTRHWVRISLRSRANLEEIYERCLSLSLIIPVFVLLLDARTTLCVARARVHLEKVVELNRFVRVCVSDCIHKINKLFIISTIYLCMCMHQ